MQPFIIFIDGARHLPTNVAFSRVSAMLFDHSFVIQRPQACISVVADENADCQFPAYKVRFLTRHRQASLVVHSNDTPLSPTTVVIIKIVAIEKSAYQVRSVGFCALNLFVDSASGQQPTADFASSDDSELLFNANSHQLPVYVGRPNVEEGEFSMDLLKQYSR